MKLEETIQKAVEGGYDNNWFINTELVRKDILCQILLDPLFWQSLGKAMGWEDVELWKQNKASLFDWNYQWHRFIDHLAEGKSIESYFSQF